MENYQGIKFKVKKISDHFEYDERLEYLNHWTWLFGQIGLTPIHQEGAYGNMSYRDDQGAFVITRTGMIPEETLNPENYTCVSGYDEEDGFITRGSYEPSSEALLHYRLYQEHPDIQAILHGHLDILNQYASALGVPVTPTFCEYGTPELAQSGVELVSSNHPLIILKDHGFVSTGCSIDEAGNRMLTIYQQLLETLKY